MGRDSGYGPLKRQLIHVCMETAGEKAVVIDDNLKAVIEAVRLGLTPLRVSTNRYRTVEALELGIPAGPTEELLHLILKAEAALEKSK